MKNYLTKLKRKNIMVKFIIYFCLFCTLGCCNGSPAEDTYEIIVATKKKDIDFDSLKKYIIIVDKQDNTEYCFNIRSDESFNSRFNNFKLNKKYRVTCRNGYLYRIEELQ